MPSGHVVFRAHQSSRHAHPAPASGPPIKRQIGLRRLTALFVSSTALVAAPAPVLAQTLWTGTTSNDWFTSSNWNTGTVPDSDSDVRVNTRAPNAPVLQPDPIFGGQVFIESLVIGEGAGSDGHLSLVVPVDNGSVGVSVYGLSRKITVGLNQGTGLLNVLLPADAVDSQAQVYAQQNLVLGDGIGSNGTLNVLSGGKAASGSQMSDNTFQTATGIVGTNGGTGTATVDDAAWYIYQSDADGAGLDGLHIGMGPGSTGTVNVLSGGKLGFSGFYPTLSVYPPTQPVGIVIGEAGGTGTLNVIGSNAAGPSTLNTGYGLIVGHGGGSIGSLNILSGGKASVYDLSLSSGIPPNLTEIGIAGGTGSVLVSGAGSVLHVGGLSQGPSSPGESATGDLYVGASGTGSLTIADSGTVNIGTTEFMYDETLERTVLVPGTPNGVLYLARDAGSTGSLNYGAVPGQPPAAVGTLNAAGIVVGQGAGHVAFNHTDPNYQFDKPISGTGAIDVYAGTTWIARDNSVGFTHTRRSFDPDIGVVDVQESFADGFGGFTNLYGGALGMSDDLALGSSTIRGIGTATLIYGTDAQTGTGVSIANPVSLDAGSMVGMQVADGGSATQTGVISGAGSVAKTGAGTLTWTANNSHSGSTVVAAGTLLAGATNIFSPNSAASVASGAILDLAGYSQSAAALTNAGFVRTGGTGSTNLTVTGPYVGQGGELELHTVVAGDGSPSDRLVIANGTATGLTGLTIVNIGGLGDRTSGNGILLVDAAVGTTAPGAFGLTNLVVAGPYEYALFRGSKDASGADSWYLRSEIPPPPDPDPATPPDPDPDPPAPPEPPEPSYYRPEVSLYAAIQPAAAIYGRDLIGTFHERFGESLRATPGQANADYAGRGYSWGRVLGHWGRRDGHSLGIYGGAPEFDYTFGGLQVGIDLFAREASSGANDRGGLYFAYGHGDLDVTHNLLEREVQGGKDKLEAYSFGAYWSHIGGTGWYLDGVVQGTVYDMSARASRGGLKTGTTSGFGFAGSLEGGYPIDLGSWTLEPQAQLVYQNLSFDPLNDGAADISFKDMDSLAGRIGARFVSTWGLGDHAEGEQPVRQASIWVRANVWHEFIADSSVEFSSASGAVPFTADLSETWAQIGLGGAVDLTRRVSLFGNVNFDTPFDVDSYGLDGRIGLKMKW